MHTVKATLAATLFAGLAVSCLAGAARAQDASPSTPLLQIPAQNDQGGTVAPPVRGGAGVAVPPVIQPAQPQAAPQKAPPRAAQPAKPTAKAAPAGATVTPLKAVSGWQGGAVTGKDGAFAYCVAESHYANGMGLLILRDGKGDFNIGVGMPGANLPGKGAWPVKLSVDNTLTRDRHGVAPQPDLLMISNGPDTQLYDAMRKGNTLIIRGPQDEVAFTLTGTDKALSELATCAERKGDGVAKIQQNQQTPLPPTLANILDQAGLKTAKQIDLTHFPANQRPADYAWVIGNARGGVQEREAPQNIDFPTLTTDYVGEVHKRCGDGKFTSSLDAPRTVNHVDIRTGSLECTGSKGATHVALLMYMTPSRLFTVFFHESGADDKAAADQPRDAILKVVEKLAADLKPEQAKPPTADVPSPAGGNAPAAQSAPATTPAKPAATKP